MLSYSTKGILCFLFYGLYLQGLQRIICLRQYNGRILFVPAPGFESYGQPASCSLDKVSSVSDKALGYQGPDTKLEDLDWREMNGPFVSVWLHNVPWGAENTLAAPDAKVSYTLYNIFKPEKHHFWIFFVVHEQEAFIGLFTCKPIVKASYVYVLISSFLMASWI